MASKAATVGSAVLAVLVAMVAPAVSVGSAVLAVLVVML
jgi:hypothetical protein